MKQIKINIPEKKDVKRWADTLRFKLTGGFTCTKCHGKNDFDHVYFESLIHSKTFILENSTRGICAECTRKELNKKHKIVFTEDDCKCDWCNTHQDTMSFPRHKDLESSVHFGSTWWNGHHICQECMNIGFDNRQPLQSSIIKSKDNVLYNQNELGLWIKRK